MPPARRLTLTEAMDLLGLESARRQLAEEALRRSEQRFRQMSHYLGKFLWLSDAETEELIYVSPGYEQVWSRQREASFALPQDWISATPPCRTNRLSERTGRRVSTEKNKPEYQVAGPDGSLRWIRDRMFPIQDEAGQTVYTLGIAEDITDLKQLETAFRTNESRARALFNLVPDMVFRLRQDGTILEFKPAKDIPLLTPTVEIVGQNLKDLLPAQVAMQAMHYLDQTLRTGQVQTFTCQHLLPDDLRDFEARSVLCGPDEVLALVRDVTDRKRLEKEILEISSREQQRIGQDLHDGLGQHLTAITFLCKALERKLTAKAQPEASEVGEIGRLVMQALSQTRNLARGLFPVELERNGLISALQELTANAERLYRIKCCFEFDPGFQITNNVVATHVFRIVQEAINNAAKHGKGQQATVTLNVKDETVTLKIADDGVGIAPGVRTEGLGLKIMQYRARRVGGTFDIQRGAEGGTVVTVAFRLKSEPN